MDNIMAINDDSALAEQYLTWTQETVARLVELSAELKARFENLEISPEADRPASPVNSENGFAGLSPAALIDEIHALAHNIKGMGSSFDFELMTTVGTSLCGFLKDIEGTRLNLAIIKAVEAHIKAFDVVMTHRIQGDGGDRGLAVIVRLEGLVQAAHQDIGA